jgi:hypothetical protein
MNNGDGAGNNRPNLSVVCTAEALMGLKGAAAAEMEYGLPISGHTLNRLCCDSQISMMLVDGKRIPVAVGHMKRTLTRAERKALQARDIHCRWPNCHRPASACDGHHVVFYSRGGPSKLDNIVSLCAMHHWRVHEGGWMLGLTHDGSVVVAPPNYARGPTCFAA